MLLLFIPIGILVDLSEKIDKLKEFDVPFNEIVDYYLNFVWYFGNTLYPIFVFLAVIWFTSKIANNSEVIAILSSGISFNRYLKPFMIAASIIAVFALFSGMFIVPEKNKKYNEFQYKYLKKKIKFFIQIHNISNLIITDISVNPTNAMEILTAGNLGLYKSIDGGNTWSLILNNGRCWDIERKVNDANTVFVAQTNPATNIVEIYKTTNISLTSPVFVPKTVGYFSPTNSTAQSAGGARIAVTNADVNRLYVVLLGNDIDYTTDNNFLGIYKFNYLLALSNLLKRTLPLFTALSKAT